MLRIPRATVAYLTISTVNKFPIWSLVLGALIGLATIAFAYRWDVTRKLVVLHYALAGQSANAFEALINSASHVAAANRMWHITATAVVKDGKYHAGASNSVKRKKATFAKAQPPYVASNLDPITIAFSKSTFYFFPDRLLIYNSGHIGAVSYKKLNAVASVSRVIEEEGVPSDSKIVERTWKYVNKTGGADKRFKNNYQLPVCAYGRVEFKSESGVNEILLMSRQGPEIDFADAVSHLAEAYGAALRTDRL